MREPDAAALAGLAALLQDRLGLALRPDGHAALRLAVLARYGDARPPPVPPEGYLALLSSPGGEAELRRLLPLVTVGKTGFFRDPRQFHALAALLPGLLARARAAGRPVAIWSAGCATGEEPYTIAMVAAEAGAEPGELELLATDVNPEALAFAMEGRYPARRAAAIPPHLRERHLEPDGDGWRVGPRLRGLLTGVRAHNLASALQPRPLAGAWDAIFCRNVVIYLDAATVRGVLGRFLAGLAPGGWLFLGYSESLFRLFEGFELAEVAGAFLYRRPEGRPAPAPAPPSAATPVPPARYAPTPVRHALAGAGPPEAGGGPEAALSAQELLDATVALCAAGRFAEARDGLARRLSRDGEDLPIRLTLANLHGILQQPAEAAACYQVALRLEPLSAEAHLLYGIHLLGLGRPGEAAEELSRALFLDPDSAIAHYYLGRCREVERDLPRARRSYRNAIEAHLRVPAGRSRPFVGHYPDLPEDGAAFGRAAECALRAL